MRPVGINREYLDPVVAGHRVDHYHHLGIASDDPILDRLGDLRAVIMAGSPARVDAFAQRWSREQDGAAIIAFPEDDRFTTRYVSGILFVSHGMGMPSASIAMQELMRLAYVLKRGNPDALDRIVWARVGTSGGIGIEPGTIVVSTEALMADLQPYRLLDAAGGYHWFDGHFPAAVVDDIVHVGSETGVPLVAGKTVSTHEFYLEQFRLDGAIRLAEQERQDEWLAHLHGHGVRNIEMEGAMLAGYLNHWGFGRFAMVCATLVDRLQGDRITGSAEQLQSYAERAGDVVLAYVRSMD